MNYKSNLLANHLQIGQREKLLSSSSTSTAPYSSNVSNQDSSALNSHLLRSSILTSLLNKIQTLQPLDQHKSLSSYHSSLPLIIKSLKSSNIINVLEGMKKRVESRMEEEENVEMNDDGEVEIVKKILEVWREVVLGEGTIC
jgi:hypothetical protein